MPFRYDLSDELEEKLSKLFRRDRNRYDAVFKKIEEIISRDEITIDFYKNLRHDLSNFKRVHIDKSFVLTFRVDKKNNLIVFEDFDHHDNVY